MKMSQFWPKSKAIVLVFCLKLLNSLGHFSNQNVIAMISTTIVAKNLVESSLVINGAENVLTKRHGL